MTNTLSPTQLALYFSPYCPYCHRVLNAMVELGLNPDLAAETASGIALKNTFSNRQMANELREGGGKSTVPCLRIERETGVEWLYESLDIVAFLQQSFAAN